MVSIIKNLNKQQKKAVSITKGPIRIIAGPGSGKTKTIIARIASMIKSGINPKSILAITFTNKAAQEMQERLETIVKNNEDKPFISTYHSFCAKLIRKHSDKIKCGSFDRNYTIMDGTDQKLLVNKIYKELKISTTLIDIDSAISYISYCKINSITVDNAYEDSKDKIEEKKAEIFEDYLIHQTKNNSLDFDDLIAYAVDILKNNKNVRKEYSNKFQFIHVDEFQDTNYMQYDLVKLLASEHNNILVVGDPDQNIYSWRGAKINIIFEFEKDFPKTKTIYLNKNYRSTKSILKLASEFIKSNKIRFDRELKTDNPKGELITVFAGFTEEEEAEWIASKVEKLINDKISPSDIMIIFRSSFISRAIEQALINKDIPFKIIGGVRFFERKEIKTALAYLRFSAQKDDVSFVQVIGSPKRGIGEQKLLQIKSVAKEQSVTLWQAITNYQEECNFTSKQKNAIKAFIKCFEKSPSDADKNFYQGLEDLLEDSGFLTALGADSKNTARYDNVKELIKSIENLCKQNNDLTTGKYLSDVALEWIGEQKEEKETVKLMTIHKAKGTESDKVFIMGLSDSILPSSRATTDPEMEEERRLFYVAATRAKNNLYLTYSKQKKPSMFFQSINPNLLQEAVWEERTITVEAEVIHDDFGAGTVLSTDGEIVEIDFGKVHGIKTLMANHKSLKIKE